MVLIEAVVLFIWLFSSANSQTEAKDENKQPSSNNQPLANLDKVLRQTNNVANEALANTKLVSNMTNALNDMAAKLRKMFAENRRLNTQIQSLVTRVQNSTGLNTTTTSLNNTIQQQAANLSSLAKSINMTNLIPRFSPNN